MGHPHIQQRNGPLTTEIVIPYIKVRDNGLLKFLLVILLVKMENGPYHGLAIYITALYINQWQSKSSSEIHYQKYVPM